MIDWECVALSFAAYFRVSIPCCCFWEIETEAREAKALATSCMGQVMLRMMPCRAWSI